MLLGTAKLLSQNRDRLKGTVRLLFQAAEEAPPGGAIEFIKAGELKGVSYVVGQHVTSLIPSGSIASYPNRAMANADEFRIRILGKGGHGSEPQNTIDALVIGANFVNAAQTVVSRMVPAFNPAVVTVGTFNSGYRYNIIAPYSELTGTVRTFDSAIREKVKTSLEKLLAGICAAYGARYEYQYIEGYPVVINNSEVNARVEEIAATILGKNSVLHPDPVMGAEDFAYYLQEVPGTFYFLGTGDDGRGINSPNHSPTFDIDENAMKYGVEILYRSAMKLLSD
jgi:amidohydrolase